MKEILLEQEFNDSVQNGTNVILFTSEGCFPCGIMKTAVKKVEKLTLDKSKFNILNVDINKNVALSEKYNIENIPTLVITHEGTEINRSEGSKPLNSIAIVSKI